MNNHAQKILIGWAKRDITPDKPVSLWGQHCVRISEYVNDSLNATALALESDDRTQRAIMVSIDSIAVENEIRNKCREILKAQLNDFNPSMLFINATHTHTCPVQSNKQYPKQAENVMTAEEYSDILVSGITEAAIEAWKKRAQGAISWGCGHAVVGFNRRATYFDGTSKMYGNTDDPNFSHIEGYEDHSVELMFTYDANKKLTGMIINVACPSQVTEGQYFVSADYWHEVREEIKSRYGQDIFVLPQCSAAGDQSPHLMLRKQAQIRMLELKGLLSEGDISSRRAVGMAERIEIGRRIANAVDDIFPLASKDIREIVPFEHKNIILELPVRMVTDEELAFAGEQVAHYKEQLEKCEPNPASRDYSSNYIQLHRFQDVIDRYERQKKEKTLSTETHIIRLGDIAFATNRFEYFLDYGIRIKARSKAIQTFIVQLAGEGSYLPTERAVKAKSYGAGIESNLVGPEGGQVIVDESVKVINSMFEE